MSLTWRDGEDLVLPPPGPAGLLRAGLRGVPLVLLLSAGLALLLLLRLGDRSLGRPRRLGAHWVPVWVFRGALRLLGLRVGVEGRPMQGPGAVVANHSSWLDIPALNAQGPMTFVAKSEVASWPGIGWLARGAGTLFIRREARRDAAGQARSVAGRLRAGERLVFFPEGTSSDNRRVLPFKPVLFAALLEPDLPDGLSVQPVTLAYEAPPGADPRFHAWFGDAAFGRHALAVLAARRQGRVRITFHPPVPVAGRDRKSLAALTEAAVRSAL